MLASEKVMENTGTDCSSGVREVWTHGNFVARQREAWCFSFLYGPPILFFFELNGSPYHGGIVTCAPLGMYYEFLLISCLRKIMPCHLECFSLRSSVYTSVA